MSVGCPIIDEMGWTVDLRLRAMQRRLPLSGMLELTRRCNLRCRHCYLGGQVGDSGSAARELDAAAVCQALDEWAAAGCLYLTITGGEPMLREDFVDIYRHAAGLGMLLVVFCNGTRVSDEVLATFCELPPRKVEISIYGATAATHERVTRVPGSHALTWDGIRRLHEQGVRVGLKTVLMTLNQHEFAAMKEQAEAFGPRFRYDTAVCPELADGDDGPLALRLGVETAVEYGTGDPERRQQWAEAIARMADVPESDRLYTCAAGSTMFHADPYGNYSPCLVATRYCVAAGGRPFEEVWRDDLGAIRTRTRSRVVDSFSGELRAVCSHCPAVNHLETGDEESESAYMERATRLRYEAVKRGVGGD